MAGCVKTISPRTLLGLQVLAFWPAWQWFWWRMSTCPNEIWEVLPLIVVAGLLFIRWRPSPGDPEQAGTDLRLPAVLTLLYAITYMMLPSLARVALAFTALTATLSVIFLKRRFHLGLWGLMLLSLQLHNGLQFYLGYPLRVFAAAITAPLLRLSGFNVIREGTCLNWGGELILIDAPCSGIKMLWAGLFLAFVLTTFGNLNTLRSMILFTYATIIVVLANILRATALFYIEANVISAPAWSHAGIGVLMFAFTAISIVLCVEKFQKEGPCAAPSL